MENYRQWAARSLLRIDARRAQTSVGGRATVGRLHEKCVQGAEVRVSFFKRLFRRSEIDSDVREEIEFHIDMRAERNHESGMDTAEAQRAARRQFGNATSVREDV